MPGRSIDHVVVAVDDLDDVATELGHLGFLVTERSDHPFGTSNRLVVLRDCYIELVAVTDPGLLPDSGFARFVSDAIAAGMTGPVMVALASNEPGRDVDRLRDAGMSVSAPTRFGRWVDLPDGDRRRAEFVTAFPDPRSTVLAGFFCQHLTPELVWRPETMKHPNGASGLVSLTLPDPGAEAWNRLALLASVDPGVELALGRVRVGKGGKSLVVAARDQARADLGPFSIVLQGPDR